MTHPAALLQARASSLRAACWVWPCGPRLRLLAPPRVRNVVRVCVLRVWQAAAELTPAHLCGFDLMGLSTSQLEILEVRGRRPPRTTRDSSRR